MVFLANLVLILLATTLAGHYCARIGLPAVLGQLLVGVIIGPAILGWVTMTDFIHDMSELGVIILMFLAGLESDLDLLKRYLKPSVLVAALGILVPAASSTAVALAFGLSMMESIFIGVLFAATSVSISVAVMKELGVLSGKGGATILGAAVIDDVVAVILLSVMVSMIGGSSEGSASLGLTLLEQLLYFISIFFVVRYIAPFLASCHDFMLGNGLYRRPCGLECSSRSFLCRNRYWSNLCTPRGQSIHRANRLCGFYPSLFCQYRLKHAL